MSASTPPAAPKPTLLEQIQEAREAVVESAKAEFTALWGKVDKAAQSNILWAAQDRSELTLRRLAGENIPEKEFEVVDAALRQYRAVAVLVFARAAGRVASVASEALASIARGFLRGLVGGGL